MKAAVGRRWLRPQRVSLIKGEVQREQAAGTSDKWMGSKSPVVAGIRALPGSGLLRPVPVLGRGQGSFPGKGGHWAESICRGSSASFRPQHLEVLSPAGKPKIPIMALLASRRERQEMRAVLQGKIERNG